MIDSYKRLISDSKISDLLNKIEEVYIDKKNNHIDLLGGKWKNSKIGTLISLKKNLDSIIDEKNEYEKLIIETKNESDKSILFDEIINVSKEKELILNKIDELILHEDSIRNNCVVEIRPGAGGVEAGLFAHDIYQMYYRFCEIKKLKLEIIEVKSDSLGNFSFISFLVKGRDAYKIFQNESGVHRVQRVPITESKGRLQTSTISVVVLPEVNDIAVKIDNKDLKIDTYRSSGAGGQHVNTTDSAIRITHIPSGIVTTSQDGRSQHDNKEKALLILKSRLFERYKAQRADELGNIRTSAIGKSERSEKIRTYNYPENRVTDHRIKITINKLDSIIKGELEDICIKLMIFRAEQKLENFIKDELNF